MDIRPCPRCRKHVPSQASFCRRCGAATRPTAVRQDAPAQRPAGRGWTSVAAAIAAAVLGGVLAMFAVSRLVVPIRLEDDRRLTPAQTATRTEAADLAAGAVRTLGAPFASSSNPRVYERSVPAVRTMPAPAAPGDLIFLPAPRPLGPQILDVVAHSAPFGHKVAIRGARLGGATRVLFIGADHGRADARFERWDDGRLLAAVPDLGPRPQDAAIAVVTPNGVAVSVPRTALPTAATEETARGGGNTAALRVIRPGEKFVGRGASIVIVESGAAARAARGATLFVRRGGSVFGRDGDDCLLFCEAGVLDRPDTPAIDCVEVGAVNPCPVESLFHYTGR